jgi:hypothetical protein
MSKIEVDAIDKQSGSTLTLGGSGTAVTLACGATQTGFGRTGTVDWQTGSIKTGTFTAVNGEGYFVNTSGGVSTANLPAGSAGAIVSFSDYTRTFGSNSFTLSPNGSEKIGGVAEDLILSVNGQALTLVYVDGTEGWINVQNADDTQTGTPPFLQATGGTVTCCGDFKIHTFTGPGTFSVSSLAPGPSGNPNNLEYLVVAGGGGAGGQGPACTAGGGAGAGGGRFVAPSLAPLTYPAKPLCGSPTPGNVITATVTSFPITVGAGGAGGNPGGAGTKSVGVNGSNSIFSTIISAGGGQGQMHPTTTGPENAGGSGGGNGGPCGASSANKGAGNTPPTTPSQGNDGGLLVSHPGNPSPGNINTGGGGGGGMIEAGKNGGSVGNPTGGGGAGGAGGGFPTAFGANGQPCGSFRYYAGGGGGGTYIPNPSPNPGGPGGLGGGGAGKAGDASPPCAVSGTTNTGGGGGAPGGQPGGSPKIGGSGGSGIVIIRYKFQ